MCIRDRSTSSTKRSGPTTSLSVCGRTARPSTSRSDMPANTTTSTLTTLTLPSATSAAKDSAAKDSAAKSGRRLIVWRHGETDHNAGGIWQGQLDTALSATGREQAKVAAVALAAYSPVMIVSSDLERAADTARALASLVGLQVRFDERLREIHAGQWQGMTAGDVAEQFPEEQAALMAGEDIQRGIDGESLGQVAERARAAIDEMLPSLAPGECAVIATHGVSGRCLLYTSPSPRDR